MNYTYKSPLGPCTIITPWNFPLYIVLNKIAPCIAYGNTCIVKPSEFTSGTAFEFCKILQSVNQKFSEQEKIDVKGVINFVFGYGQDVGSTLTSDFRVKAVAFTGSTATAQKINISAAHHLKKIGLECGGKNPALIFADANLDKAVEVLKSSCFGNNGQICVNTERVYVQEEIFEVFKDKLVKMVENMIVNEFGDPMNEATFIGPQSSEVHYKKVTGMVNRALDQDQVTSEIGFRSENNSDEVNQKIEKLAQTGYFFPPTVLTNFSSQDLEIIKNEVFGPICLLMPFKTEVEGIKLANDTIYGLSGVVFSENLSRAHRVARQIEAGCVWVNNFGSGNEKTPFGGMKLSGIDRESDDKHEEFFTCVRNIGVLVDDE